MRRKEAWFAKLTDEKSGNYWVGDKLYVVCDKFDFVAMIKECVNYEVGK